MIEPKLETRKVVQFHQLRGEIDERSGKLGHRFFNLDLRAQQFYTLSLADIPVGSRNKRPMFSFQWTQADLYREFAALFFQTPKLTSGSHWPDDRTYRIGTLVGVSRAETLRYEHFYSLADQFFSAVAKQLFGLNIDENDLALTIDNRHEAPRAKSYPRA